MEEIERKRFNFDTLCVPVHHCYKCVATWTMKYVVN